MLKETFIDQDESCLSGVRNFSRAVSGLTGSTTGVQGRAAGGGGRPRDDM